MSRCRLFALASVGLVSVTGCPAPQKTIEAQVEHDGKVVLRGGFTVPMDTTPADGWYRLEGVRLRAVGPVATDPADPTAAVLTGEVRVALTHDGKQFSAAQLDRLRVERVPGTEDQWAIPRAELERATKPALRPGFEKKGP